MRAGFSAAAGGVAAGVWAVGGVAADALAAGTVGTAAVSTGAGAASVVDPGAGATSAGAGGPGSAAAVAGGAGGAAELAAGSAARDTVEITGALGGVGENWSLFSRYCAFARSPARLRRSFSRSAALRALVGIGGTEARLGKASLLPSSRFC
jgi:hypothetical protein